MSIQIKIGLRGALEETADGKTNNRVSEMQIADIKTNKLIITVQHQKVHTDKRDDNSLLMQLQHQKTQTQTKVKKRDMKVFDCRSLKKLASVDYTYTFLRGYSL